MEEKDNELQTNFGATRCSICRLALVGTTGCRWAPLGKIFLLRSTELEDPTICSDFAHFL